MLFRDYWQVDYKGHTIEVENKWGTLNLLEITDFAGEVTLKIDGEHKDSMKSLIALGHKPSLRGTLVLADDIRKRVEVYFKSGLFSMKVKICIDGIRIQGDDF